MDVTHLSKYHLKGSPHDRWSPLANECRVDIVLGHMRDYAMFFCAGEEIPGVVLTLPQAYGRFPTSCVIGAQAALFDRPLQDDGHLGVRSVGKPGRAVLELVICI